MCKINFLLWFIMVLVDPMFSLDCLQMTRIFSGLRALNNFNKTTDILYIKTKILPGHVKTYLPPKFVAGEMSGELLDDTFEGMESVSSSFVHLLLWNGAYLCNS